MLYIHVHTRAWLCLYVYIRVQVGKLCSRHDAHKYTGTYIHVRAYVCIHVHTCANMYIHVHTCAYMCMVMYKHRYVQTWLCYVPWLCAGLRYVSANVCMCRGYVPTWLCPWLCLLCPGSHVHGYVHTRALSHGYVHVHGYVHGHGYVRAWLCPCANIFMFVCGYARMCAWLCPCALSRGYTRAKHVRAYVHVCSHGHGYVHVCVYVHVVMLMLCVVMYVMLCVAMPVMLCYVLVMFGTHPPAAILAYTNINFCQAFTFGSIKII